MASISYKQILVCLALAPLLALAQPAAQPEPQAAPQPGAAASQPAAQGASGSPATGPATAPPAEAPPGLDNPQQPISGNNAGDMPVEAPPASLPDNATALPVPGPDGANPPNGAPSAPLPRSETYVIKQDKDTRKRALAIFRTTMGNFTVQLAIRQAPRTTQHFIELVRGEKEFIDSKSGRKIRRPFYNGLTFHRVVKNFIIQGGCPFGNGKGGPGYTLADEFNPGLRHRKAGIVSMANAGSPNTNGSQFFITLGPRPEFDDKYTVIGEVIQGMNIIKDIARVRVGPTDRPIKRISIIAIDIVEE